MKKMLAYIVLTYLRVLASLQLTKNKSAIVIGITGSAGKTSTRKAIALILRTKGIVRESVKANSESGIPLNILGLALHSYRVLDWLRVIILAPVKLLTNWEHFDYYIVEMGIDSPSSPKNMSYLLKIIRPDVAVVLNTGLVHGESFDHLVIDRDPLRRQQKIKEEIAKEKMKLAYGIKPTGFAVINTDQKELSHQIKGIKARVLTFGSKKEARFQILKSSIVKTGFRLDFSYQNQDFALSLPDIYEEGFMYTFAAALSVAVGLGIPIDYSLKALNSYRAPAGRMRIFKGINNSTIIDSSYNASPATVLSALTLLSKVAVKGKRIAVLGDMRELGRGSKYAHKLLADWIKKYTDQVLLFGPESKEYTLPVLQKSSFPVTHFDSIGELIKATQNISESSTILVKGSQNTIYLERVVEALLADKDDHNQLCRRGPYWDKLRANTP